MIRDELFMINSQKWGNEYKRALAILRSASVKFGKFKTIYPLTADRISKPMDYSKMSAALKELKAAEDSFRKLLKQLQRM
ncbi:MAG: hypothetical protein L0Y74_03685 [candidate division Zixibacteria bacterium]|nr:hypothetical protein [candidate division Zixibacteria bacterium]